jgi:hypothetical protein
MLFCRPAVSLAVLGLLGLFGEHARADLDFPQPQVNVGEVRCGVPLTHRFVFTNQGPHVVQITETKASCGCLAPRLERQSLKPGEEGAVVLEVKTLTQGSGPHTWRVDVRYRDGEQLREVPLLISGRIVTEVLVQPPELTLSADRAIRHEITVTDLRAQPLSVVEVRTSSPHLKACVGELVRNEAGRSVRKIGLEVADDFPEGRHAEVVTIVTDDPVYRDFQVAVTVIKRSRQRLEAVPNAVTLLAPAGQPVPARVVLIRDRDEQKVEVDRIVADDPALVCSRAAGPNNLVTVKISADRSRIQGNSLTSAIHIYLSKPVPETVTVPVKCNLQ